MIRFDFDDLTLRKNFELRKELFLESDLTYFFPHRICFFKNSLQGYISFVKKVQYKDVYSCSKKMNYGEQIVYLQNLTDLFVALEDRKIHVILFESSKIGCTLERITIPLFSNLNSIYPSNDEVYRHYYRKKLKSGKQVWSKILLDLYTGNALNKISNSKPEGAIVLNAYSFLYVLQMVCSIMTFQNKSLRHLPFLRLKALVSILNSYISKFMKGKSKFLTAEDMKRIYSMISLLKKNEPLNNLLRPKSFPFCSTKKYCFVHY